MTTTTFRRLLTADEYQQMAETGILSEDERIELLGGEIYHLAAIGVRHANAVRALNRILNRQVGTIAIVDVQNPIRLDDESMPQPDILVLRDRNYAALPTPGDLFILIEVGDSSHDSDRRTKFPRYAAAGIPEAWLVDLANDVIERYSEPRNRNYRVAMFAHVGESLTSTVLPVLTIPADLVLDPDETEP